MAKKSREGIYISYVLPTYNRVEYLGECLLSLVEQKYDPKRFEVIVVDDGSDDSTPELMEYFIAEHKNIFYYQVEHKGVEDARNFGNQRAKADIIGVCDSDDLYHEERTHITCEFFRDNPDIDIMTGSYVEIDHRGLPIKFYQAGAIDKELFLAGKETYFCHDNCAYRKDKVFKTPYRKEGQPTDDWKLVEGFLKADYKFGFTTKELCKVRTLNNGIMGARRERLGIKLPYV